MSYKDFDPFNYMDLKPQNYKFKQNMSTDLDLIIKTLENISNDWKGDQYGGWASAGDSFIFTLTNMYNIVPAKFPAKDFCNIKYYSNKGI